MGFEDLIGQTPIIKVLQNAIAQGKMAHAYVFSGPRGVGKTSTARILAKSLNCVEGPTPHPCGKCPSCVGITEGNSVDVMEIDGASNTGVDNIRDLRERVKYAPSGGRYKVYIIDEAHMLSTAAFNALLKTLEEPPPHVIFVMATTEPKKIPLTVMSRCQHLPFRRVSTQSIKERLKFIANSESIGISDGALSLVARAADGSIRDSLTILDQLASFTSDITEEDVKGLFDTADFKVLAEMAEAIVEGHRAQILEIVDALVDRGSDLRTFTKDLIQFFRDLLVASLLRSGDQGLDASEEELGALRKIASEVTDEHLTLILSELVKAEADVRFSFSPRVALEMSLIKISYLSTFRTINEALATISGTMSVDHEPGLPPSPSSKQVRPSIARKTVKSSPKVELVTEETSAPEVDVVSSPDPEPYGVDDSEGEALEEYIAEAETIPETKAPAPFTGASLLEAITDRLHDPILSSKLSRAEGSLEGDILGLTFSSSDAEICAQPFKDKPETVEKLATELMGIPVKIEIHIEHSKKNKSTPLKEKVMAEPVVQEALELFEGRVVNVKPMNED